MHACAHTAYVLHAMCMNQIGLAQPESKNKGSTNLPAMVDIPRVTPMVESIYSPYSSRFNIASKYRLTADIMMRLSKKPNPIKGRAA